MKNNQSKAQVAAKKWLWWYVSDKNFNDENSREFMLLHSSFTRISPELLFLRLTHHHSTAIFWSLSLFLTPDLSASGQTHLNSLAIEITVFCKLVFLCRIQEGDKIEHLSVDQ